MELANDGTVLDVQGARIPRLGFGTWLLEGDDAYDGVRDDLRRAQEVRVDVAEHACRLCQGDPHGGQRAYPRGAGRSSKR